MLPSPKCLELAGLVVERAKAKGLMISIAESCTGGMLAASITTISGSSDVFGYGFVTYSNASKSKLLAVPAELINKAGSVSQVVAESMALGCLRVSGADLAVGVTGVAGPDGGTAEVPVGTVYVGIAAGSKVAGAMTAHSLMSRHELAGVLVERYAMNTRKLGDMGSWSDIEENADIYAGTDGDALVYSARLNITGARAAVREQACYFALQELGVLV